MDDDILKSLQAQQYNAAFELLLDRFKEKVFRLALSMMRNQSQAEDVAQDVFVKIWKGLPGYNNGASLSTWIYAITRNTCLTELRKRSSRPTVSLQQPEMEAVADRISVLHAMDDAQCAKRDVAALLSELPERYRQVITLFYLEEKTYDEVALMLAIPLGTVKTLIHRAKKELLRIGSRDERGFRQNQQAPLPSPCSIRRPSDAAFNSPIPNFHGIPIFNLT